MGYRNKTYVIFDGDEDMWAYSFMKGWNKSEHIDFDFHDAHEINNLSDNSSEDTVKRKLRERFSNTKQAIVLIGKNTKNLYRYVRWELETCLNLDIPIIAVNLNDKRKIDDKLCPAIIKDKAVIHVAFRMKIIQYAMDNFCEDYDQYKNKKDMFYYDSEYTRLGL
jgi:hypothetical protein